MKMPFDPFTAGPSGNIGREKKKRAFLVGNAKGRVHFLVKMVLYRAQSINCYHLGTGERRQFLGRTTPTLKFDAIRDEFMKNGTEVRYPNDIPEGEVDRWVEFGKAEAKRLGLEIKE
jgi:hypothetical protein